MSRVSSCSAVRDGTRTLSGAENVCGRSLEASAEASLNGA